MTLLRRLYTPLQSPNAAFLIFMEVHIPDQREGHSCTGKKRYNVSHVQIVERRSIVGGGSNNNTDTRM